MSRGYYRLRRLRYPISGRFFLHVVNIPTNGRSIVIEFSSMRVAPRT